MSWIDPKLDIYIQEHIHSNNEDIETFRAKEVEARIPIIKSDIEQFITFMIQSHKIESILEIGTATGYSAIAFSEALPESGHILTLERDSLRYEAALENIKRFKKSAQITALLGSAEETLLTIDRLFDMIFIDAAKSHYKKFFDAALPLLAEGGIIICDNILFGGRVYDSTKIEKRYRTSARRMVEFLEYITKEPYETVILPIGDGLSITQIKRS
jgi:predicted O-methyltransferase YrrM